MKLVLLPGLDGSGLLFEPFVAALPSTLEPKIVRYPPDQACGYEELLPVVQAALPGNEPFVLLGESFSGPLALMAAAAHPAGMRGVVLCATFVQSPLRWPIVAAALSAVLPHVPRHVTTRVMLGQQASGELAALFWRAQAQLGPGVLEARVRALLAVDARAAARACPVPLFYLGAKSDRLVTARAFAALARERPDIERSELDGPHLILQAEPRASAAAIARFVARTS